MLSQGIEDLLWAHPEEFATGVVDLVDSLLCELPVEHGLDADSVVAEEHRVDVECKWDGRIPKLPDAVHWFQPPRHADLDDTFAESAEVGDDIHVAGPNVRRSVVSLRDFSIDAVQFGLERIGSRGVTGVPKPLPKPKATIRVSDAALTFWHRSNDSMPPLTS